MYNIRSAHMCIKASQVTGPIIQKVIQSTNKNTLPSQLRIIGPLWWESTGHRWIPTTKGQ